MDFQDSVGAAEAEVPVVEVGLEGFVFGGVDDFVGFGAACGGEGVGTLVEWWGVGVEVGYYVVDENVASLSVGKCSSPGILVLISISLICRLHFTYGVWPSFLNPT